MWEIGRSHMWELMMSGPTAHCLASMHVWPHQRSTACVELHGTTWYCMVLCGTTT